LLSKLSSLNIYDTRIGMDGLRLFATTFSRLNRMIDIDVPSSCSEYLESKIFPHTARPLIRQIAFVVLITFKNKRSI
jgi:hypothetical protein